MAHMQRSRSMIVLFCLAVYLLLYHRSVGGAGRTTFVVVTLIMVVLATSQVVMQISTAVLAIRIFRLAIEGVVWPNGRAFNLTILYDKVYAAGDLVLVTNNVVTDGLFIYRCFIVWGRNFRIVILPALMLIVSTVLGYIAVIGDDYIYTTIRLDARWALGMIFLTNVLLMILTAGRIWWIRRDAALVLDPAYLRKYDTVIALILESGALYCLTIILYLIFVPLHPSVRSSSLPYHQIEMSTSQEASTVVIRAIMPQVMNIAPTLIIVRVGLDKGAKDTASDRTPRMSPRPRRAVTRGNTLNDGAPTSSFVINIRPVDHADGTEGEISLTELGKEEV
ncbi:hypothetical protein B0H16DRAFT_1008171 [Mycena metata]|uniref:Uncharacterized protein n=1 Tax=Mycena metata TaxID=1033252 RepID=A0AAD7N446_9AGAR|nr:hypothetical protein B0H16DRAFT_1008171 [Mycena metata]